MEQLDQLRKRALLFRIISIIVIIASIALAIAVYTMIGIGVIVGIILLIVSAVMSSNFKKSIAKVFKEEFESRYPGYTYDKKSGVNINKVYEGGLIYKDADKYHVEDLITAKFDNGTVFSSDLHMIEVRVYRDSKGNTRREDVTFFLGRYYIFDFDNHEFETNMKCFEKGLRYVNTKGLEKCETESIAFNEKYKTFTNDQLNLYKYLKPQIIEGLTEIEKRYKGAIGFSIYANQIHIAVYNNRNNMEFSITKKVNEDLFNKALGRSHDEIENMIKFLNANAPEFSK